MRESASERGYGHAWRIASKGYLRSHPCCVHCLARGIVRQSTDVDHIEPHRGDQAKFWDVDGNWQALCHACHAVKTAKYDGGFGNARS